LYKFAKITLFCLNLLSVFLLQHETTFFSFPVILSLFLHNLGISAGAGLIAQPSSFFEEREKKQ